MERVNLLAIVAIVILTNVAVGAVVMNYSPSSDDSELSLKINGSHAVQIVTEDTNASRYINKNYDRPEWRVVKATLVQDAVYDLNGNTTHEGDDVWKVEFLERTCACSSVSDLYVLEGHVSADTGELLSLKTDSISEREYEKTTCSTTVCH